MEIDHVVIWVGSAQASLDFYVNILGLEPVREKAFAQGHAPFPSVRINPTSLIDIMELGSLPGVRDFTGSNPIAGGAPTNHICLSMSLAEFDAMVSRLELAGHQLKPGGTASFGAQGHAVRSSYLTDPDGNVIEIRYYQD